MWFGLGLENDQVLLGWAAEKGRWAGDDDGNFRWAGDWGAARRTPCPMPMQPTSGRPAALGCFTWCGQATARRKQRVSPRPCRLLGQSRSRHPLPELVLRSQIHRYPGQAESGGFSILEYDSQVPESICLLSKSRKQTVRTYYS